MNSQLEKQLQSLSDLERMRVMLILRAIPQLLTVMTQTAGPADALIACSCAMLPCMSHELAHADACQSGEATFEFVIDAVRRSRSP